MRAVLPGSGSGVVSGEETEDATDHMGDSLEQGIDYVLNNIK